MALKVTPTALLSIFFIFSPKKEPRFLSTRLFGLLFYSLFNNFNHFFCRYTKVLEQLSGRT